MNRINIPLSILEDDLNKFLKLGIQTTLDRHNEKFKIVADSISENLDNKDGKLILKDMKSWAAVFQETLNELGFLLPLINGLVENDTPQPEENNPTVTKTNLVPDTEIVEDLLDLEEDSLAIDSRSE